MFNVFVNPKDLFFKTLGLTSLDGGFFFFKFVRLGGLAILQTKIPLYSLHTLLKLIIKIWQFGFFFFFLG
jgi:hypothetical protein